MNVLNNIGLHLSDLLLTLLATILLVRALLHSSGNVMYHPLLDFIYTLTRPLLSNLHNVLPPTRQVDIACYLMVYLTCALEIYLKYWFLGGGGFPLVLFFVAAFNMIELIAYIYIIATLAFAISGWFMSPYQQACNPLLSLANALIAPLLRPLRRVIPDFGAIDVSPMVLVLLLYVVIILVRSFH